MSELKERLGFASFTVYCTHQNRCWQRLGDATRIEQLEAEVRRINEAVLDDIAVMMSEFVDNWPQPKRVSTALALIAKTLRAALSAMPEPSVEGMREALVEARALISGTKLANEPEGAAYKRLVLDKIDATLNQGEIK